MRVSEGYPRFSSWLEQNGWPHADRYQFPSTRPNSLGLELFDYAPTHAWTVTWPEL